MSRAIAEHDTARAAATPPLPSPSGRPTAAVVIYDGHCSACVRVVSAVARWDSQGKLAYLSLHEPAVAERYPDLQHEDLMREIYLVDAQQERFHGVAALREICRRVGRLRPLLPLFILPGGTWVLQRFYTLFARFRYRFGHSADCEDGACRVPFR